MNTILNCFMAIRLGLFLASHKAYKVTDVVVSGSYYKVLNRSYISAPEITNVQLEACLLRIDLRYRSLVGLDSISSAMASASLPIGDRTHGSPASDAITSSETAAPGQDHGHHNIAHDELTILPQFKFTFEEVDYLNFEPLNDDDEEEAAADRIAADDDDDDLRFQEEADDVAHAARN